MSLCVFFRFQKTKKPTEICNTHGYKCARSQEHCFLTGLEKIRLFLKESIPVVFFGFFRCFFWIFLEYIGFFWIILKRKLSFPPLLPRKTNYYLFYCLRFLGIMQTA